MLWTEGKGLVKKSMVKDLLSPFEGELAQTYVAGTSKQSTLGFLEGLNVFSEHMSGKVGRPQYDGTFDYQSVPPLLPAYNKFMGAVDRLGNLMVLTGNQSSTG